MNDVKIRINKVLHSAGFVGGDSFDVSDEAKLRIVTEDCNAGNIVVIRGRIQGQSNFVNLKTLTGLVNEVVKIDTYDVIQIECTSFDPAVGSVRVIASSFNEAGGSAIESIGAPSGDALTDIEQMSFTSSDDSITITGDNINKTIDFKISTTGSTYVDSFIFSEWILSLGTYSLSYPQSVHLKGATPSIDIYELLGGIYSPVDVSTEIDGSGNITFKVPQTPDLRFGGLVIIR